MSSIHSVFNFKVFRQNFRSCQGMLLVCAIIYQCGILMNAFALSQLDITQRVINFEQFSGIVSFLACFLLPMAVAALLFDFLFSKKKSDLVFSSPIPRRTWFWSNYLGGLLFLAVNLLAATVILHVTLTRSPQLVYESGMTLRFLILWGVSWLLVYSCCCLAVSLTGSRFVYIVLVVLFTLLPGWLHYTYLNQYYGYENNGDFQILATETLSEPLSRQIPHESVMSMDTVPYLAFNHLALNFSGSYQEFRISSYYTAASYSLDRCWIMLFDAAVMTILGAVAFLRRKVEVAETSMISEIIHDLIRVAVFVPFFYTLGMKDWFSALLYGGVLLILIHLYDILARREIIQLRRTLISFAVMVLCASVLRFPVKILARKEASRQIALEEVQAAGLAPLSSYLNQDVGNSPLLKLKLTDHEIIALLFEGAAEEPDYEAKSQSFYVRYYLKNTYHDFTLTLSEQRLEAITELLENNDEYQVLYRNMDIDNIYQILMSGLPTGLTADQRSTLLQQIQQEVLTQDFRSLIANENQIACRNPANNNACYFNLSLISFRNGETIEKNLDLLTYDSVFRMFAGFNNQQFIEEYQDTLMFMNFYSMWDNEIEQVRQLAGIDIPAFNRRLADYIQTHLTIEFTEPSQTSDQYLFLSYYDDARRSQGTVILEKDENWQTFLQSLASPE